MSPSDVEHTKRPATAVLPTEIARAKINLTLHVGRIIQDPQDVFHGYHPVDSLVVFANMGDAVSATGAAVTELSSLGPFAQDLGTAEDNMVLRAYKAVARDCALDPMAFTLVKNLPVASGMGGGSANAAAALRLIKAHENMKMDMAKIAQGLGADVSVCLASETAHMTGIGESVTPISGLGSIPAVLVNPGVGLSTRDIFTAFDAGTPRETPRPQKMTGTLLERALDGRNDLEAVAISKAPIIDKVLTELRQFESCTLARMSGSGATCFGLFETDATAQSACAKVFAAYPEWWCRNVRLGDERG